MMRTGVLDCFSREWQKKRSAMVIGVPLIVVVIAEKVAGLTRYDVEGGIVQV